MSFCSSERDHAALSFSLSRVERGPSRLRHSPWRGLEPRLDQIRRGAASLPPGHHSPTLLSQCEPRNICFEMHCSAACLHHNKPLFFISPLQQLSSTHPPAFSPSLLPMSSPSVLEDSSRTVMSAWKARPVLQAGLHLTPRRT